MQLQPAAASAEASSMQIGVAGKRALGEVDRRADEVSPASRKSNPTMIRPPIRHPSLRALEMVGA